MNRPEHHWRLYRYLRYPIMDLGVEDTPVSHKAVRIPGDYIGLFNDKSLGTICCDALETTEAANLVMPKLRVGGCLVTCVISDEAIKAITATVQAQVWEEHGFHIVRRLSGSNGLMPRRQVTAPGAGQKKVCIVRYGAIGDHLMVSPLIQHYHDEGWHVTYNCTRTGETIYKDDPRVDDLLVQEDNIIQNKEEIINPFWDKMAGDYDKFINLAEVIEGDLLRIEGRPNFSDSWEQRMVDCGGNYIDHHFERAGLDIRGRMPAIYLTEDERTWALQKVSGVRKKLGKEMIVLWNMMGSSFHKMYPWVFDVWNLVKHNGDDIGFIAVGDVMSQFLTGNEYSAVATNLCGKLKLRQSISLHSAVDAVVTPETWSLVAAHGFDAPVIALLSHSGKGNYVWAEGDVPLAPSSKDCPCYPCHQLHYSRRGCPPGVIEKSAVRCMDQIEPVKIYRELLKIRKQMEEDNE